MAPLADIVLSCLIELSVGVGFGLHKGITPYFDRSEGSARSSFPAEKIYFCAAGADSIHVDPDTVVHSVALQEKIFSLFRGDDYEGVLLEEFPVFLRPVGCEGEVIR